MFSPCLSINSRQEQGACDGMLAFSQHRAGLGSLQCLQQRIESSRYSVNAGGLQVWSFVSDRSGEKLDADQGLVGRNWSDANMDRP